MALVSHICRFITIVLLTLFLSPSNAQTEVKYVDYYCFDRGHYAENSTYEENLVAAVVELDTQASNSIFYNTTAGSAPDEVYALYYCRGDLSLQICQACVKQAVLYVAKNCPRQREAIAWYEYCTVRYANRMIFGKEDEERGAYWRAVEQVKDQGQFNKTVKDGLASLIQDAVSGNSTTENFAIGEADLTSSEKLYGLVQCTPDLSPDECLSCLTYAANETNICCGGRAWAMLMLPSCQIRYALSSSSAAPGAADAPALAPSDSTPSDLSPSDSTPSDLSPSDSTPSVSSPSGRPSSSSKSPTTPSIISNSPGSSTTDTNSPPAPKSSTSPFHKNQGSWRQTSPSYAAVVAILMTVSAVLLSIGFQT
ncbi:hypothetical protein Ancab_033640 [Ancistrocladus abbreviatus]